MKANRSDQSLRFNTDSRQWGGKGKHSVFLHRFRYYDQMIEDELIDCEMIVARVI